MSEILLVQQPAKESNSKVWFNGKWENADQAGIPVKEAGKIKPSDLPDVAIVPKWDINESYRKYQLVSRSNMIYKALGDIPAGTDFQVVNTDAVEFAGWTLVSNPNESAVMKSYNELVAENHLFKVGEVITNNNVLYQVVQQNVAASIFNESFFTPLKTNTVLGGFEIAKSYKAGTLIIYGVAESVWVATKDVPSGNIFNAGKEWVRVNESDVQLITKFSRLPNVTTKPANAPKEYYDYDLKLMMLYRNDGSWAQYDGIKETIIFPTNPTNGQAFTSTMGNTYQYDATNYYWKLTASSSTGTARSHLFAKLASTASAQTLNSVLTLTTVRSVGDSIARGTGTQIALRYGYTYKITYNVSASSLGTSWARWGIYNDTLSNWIPEQMYASIWGSTAYTNTPVGVVYITPTENNMISLRCAYSGQNHNIVGGGENSNDGGDTWILVEEVDGSNITDKRSTVVLEGERIDFLLARLTSTYNAPGNNTPFDLPFNVNVTSIGEVVNNNGVFTLKANKTYELVADIMTNIQSSGRVGFAWVDSNNNRLAGTYGGKVPPNSTETFSPQSIARSIITPSADMQVKVRVNYDTGGAHTIYPDDNSLGSSYAMIRQLGSSKVITEVVNSGVGDPKNFVTRDTTNAYSPTKHVVDFYFQSYTSTLPAADVALRCGSTDPEKRARFWFLLQKFGAVVGGTDNDTFFDGVFGGVQFETNKQTTLNNAGMMTNSIYTGSVGDVDPIAAATATTEWYKLVLGRDAANNIWFVPVTVYYLDGAAAGATGSFGIKYYNTANTWVNSDSPASLPKLISATGFTAGTATTDNNLIAGGQPALQYLPHRLELA